MRVRTGGAGSLSLGLQMNFGRGDTECLILGPGGGGGSPYHIWFVLSLPLQKRTVFMVQIRQRRGVRGASFPTRQCDSEKARNFLLVL